MIIDVNGHWLPKELFTDESIQNAYIRCVPQAYGEQVTVTNIPGKNMRQIIFSKPKGCENVNFTERDTLADDRLGAMDKVGVDKVILRLIIWEEYLTLELCKKTNDWMAEFIKQSPNRFMGLATVPPWGDKDCLYELERCIKELGFVGVNMPAHYGNLYLDAEEFRPHFRKINDLKVPAVIHHTSLPVDYDSLTTYTNVRRTYGRSVAQMTNLMRILFSNLLEECPDLILIPTLLGGAFFAYADILVLSRRKSVVEEDMERHDITAPDRIKGYLERNLYFDISHAPPWGKPQLECAVKVLGADHILWGSSYPLRKEWLLNGVDYLKSLDISEKAKKQILGENAIKVFNIKN
jgi:predicted TIM-barrel fold metal-dependent hydrolase